MALCKEAAKNVRTSMHIKNLIKVHLVGALCLMPRPLHAAPQPALLSKSQLLLSLPPQVIALHHHHHFCLNVSCVCMCSYAWVLRWQRVLLQLLPPPSNTSCFHRRPINTHSTTQVSRNADGASTLSHNGLKSWRQIYILNSSFQWKYRYFLFVHIWNIELFKRIQKLKLCLKIIAITD